MQGSICNKGELYIQGTKLKAIPYFTRGFSVDYVPKLICYSYEGDLLTLCKPFRRSATLLLISSSSSHLTSLFSLMGLDGLQVYECFVISLESLILVFHPIASSSLPHVTLLQSPIFVFHPISLGEATVTCYWCGCDCVLSVFSHLIGTPHLSIPFHCQLITSPHVSPYSRSFLLSVYLHRKHFFSEDLGAE